MDGQLLQTKIWHGYRKAAEKLGSEYQFSRPDYSKLELEGGGELLLEGGGELNLAGPRNFPGTHLFTRPVSLNAEDMKYGKPNKYGKATWYALVDGKGLEVGDYFDGAQGMFFIAAMQLLLPILVVECNRVISIFRPQPQTGSGAQPYSGITPANEKSIVTGVPCSILQGTKGEKNETALPSDTRTPWWTILMPGSVGHIKYGDLIIDDFGQRYIASSAENTDLGWRINAAMTVA